MNSLKVMVITDGKMGDLMQCRGIAQRLTSADNIAEKVVEPGSFHALPLPFVPVQKSDRSGHANSPFEQPLPDIVIASGRRTVPYLRHFKKTTNAGKMPFTVFLKDPRIHRGSIDFIWAPTHDGLKGKNIFVTDTSPHAMSADRLKQAAVSAALRFSDLPAPYVGVVLGGNSKKVQWSTETAEIFATHLAKVPRGHSILITASRRTPEVLLSTIQSKLSDRKVWIWDGDGKNPYAKILALADQLVITGDSHNMVSEALATGKSAHVFRPPGLAKKLGHFLDGLQSNGKIHELSGVYGGAVPQSPIDATPEITDEILRRYTLFRTQTGVNT